MVSTFQFKIKPTQDFKDRIDNFRSLLWALLSAGHIPKTKQTKNMGGGGDFFFFFFFLERFSSFKGAALYLNHYWKDTGNTSSHWSSSTDTCVEQYPSLKDLQKQQPVMDTRYCFSWGKNASRSAGLTQWPETIPSQDTIPKTDLNKNNNTYEQQNNNNKIHIVIQVLFHFKTSASLILFLIKWGRQAANKSQTQACAFGCSSSRGILFFYRGYGYIYTALIPEAPQWCFMLCIFMGRQYM